MAIPEPWKKLASSSKLPANEFARLRPRLCARCVTRHAFGTSRASSKWKKRFNGRLGQDHSSGNFLTKAGLLSSRQKEESEQPTCDALLLWLQLTAQTGHIK